MTSGDGAKWYASRDGEVFGPFTVDQLAEAARRNELRAHDLVCRSHSKEWVKAGNLAELAPLFDEQVSTATFAGSGEVVLPPLPPPASPQSQLTAPRPTTPATPRVSGSASTSPPGAPEGASPDVAPAPATAIWKTSHTLALSFFCFSAIFGHLMLALNWRRLGQPSAALRCVLWMALQLVIWVACLAVLAALGAGDGVNRIVGTGVHLLGMAFLAFEVTRQDRFIRSRPVSARSWVVPVLAGLGVNLSCVGCVILGGLAGSAGDHISPAVPEHATQIEGTGWTLALTSRWERFETSDATVVGYRLALIDESIVVVTVGTEPWTGDLATYETTTRNSPDSATWTWEAREPFDLGGIPAAVARAVWGASESRMRGLLVLAVSGGRGFYLLCGAEESRFSPAVLRTCREVASSFRIRADHTVALDSEGDAGRAGGGAPPAIRNSCDQLEAWHCSAPPGTPRLIAALPAEQRAERCTQWRTEAETGRSGSSESLRRATVMRCDDELRATMELNTLYE